MRRHPADVSGMRKLGGDAEQVAFWRRHMGLGIGLCFVLPGLVLVRTFLTPDHPHRVGLTLLAVTTLALAPALLLVRVERVVESTYGRLFFDAWEAVGVVLVTVVAVLDGGSSSLYVFFYFVVLAHAALAYPPAGMVIAGLGVTGGYLTAGVVAGGTPVVDLVFGVLMIAVATATCAFASHNHVLAYRRTAAYARQIAELADLDGLTGCLNHRAFHERLAAADVGPDSPLSVVLVDVDSFKEVNDLHGHPVGDQVLRMIGRVLEDVSRASDVAGRLGGDEFALLLPGTSERDATAVAERLRERVGAQGAPHGVSVSVGVGTARTLAEVAGLRAVADRALYLAKGARPGAGLLGA